MSSTIPQIIGIGPNYYNLWENGNVAVKINSEHVSADGGCMLGPDTAFGIQGHELSVSGVVFEGGGGDVQHDTKPACSKCSN